MNPNRRKWTPSRTFAFVKSYSELPQLWDSKHKHYRNLRHRVNAYMKLSQQFSISLTDVKQKIKNLRSTYFQEVKKAKEKDYQTNLVWFNEMKKIVSDSCERNDNSNNTNGILSNSKLEESLMEDNVSIKDEQVSEGGSSMEKFPELLPEDLPVIIDRSHMKLKEPSSNQDDEFDIFGRHVASQLRQMNIYRALNLEMKIQQLLTQERINDIKEANEWNNQTNNQFSQHLQQEPEQQLQLPNI